MKREQPDSVAQPHQFPSLIWGLAAVVGFAVLTALEFLHVSNHTLFFDFHAFYCGGWAVAHGLNAYAAAPLMTCESVGQPLALYSTSSSLAVPAPFPGYALAFFMPFSLLPYAIAAALWLAFLLICAALALAVLARLTCCPFPAVLMVFAMTLAIVVLPLGQLTSITLCALVMAAAAVRNGKMVLAAGTLCVAALSPHIAMPVFLALFVWIKESRRPLIGAVLALTALDLAVSGPSIALSYFTFVLPAHAHAEIGGALQYSLTWLVHAAGVSNETALRSGDVWYGLMVVCGIVAGGLLARRFNDRAFVILVPPAFAVIGGPFVHLQEISLALPVALLLYSHAHSRAAKITPVLAGLALLLLAAPWLWTMDQPWLIAVIAIVTAGVARGVLGLDLSRSLRAALGAVAICACVMIIGARYGAHSYGTQGVPKTVNFHARAELAQASWARFVVNGSGITWIVGKAPTWVGLLLLAAGCAYAVRSQEDDVRPIAIEHAPART